MKGKTLMWFNFNDRLHWLTSQARNKRKRNSVPFRPILEPLEDRCVPATGSSTASLFGAFSTVEQSQALGGVLIQNASQVLASPTVLGLVQGLLHQDAHRLGNATQAIKRGEQSASPSDPTQFFWKVLDFEVGLAEFEDRLLGLVFHVDLSADFQGDQSPSSPASSLGNPVGGTTALGIDNIVYQMYQNGAVVGTPGQPLVEVKGDIFTRWRDLGGINGPLSFPTSAPYTIHNTTVQDFYGGWIVTNPNAGTLAVQGGTSRDLSALISPAAMLGQGLSLNSGSSLGLWTPVVDDLKQLGGDIAHAAHNDTDTEDLRYGSSSASPPPSLPPIPPSPFHYSPSLINAPPTSPKLSADDALIFQNGALEWIQYYSSTNPAASWLDSSSRFRSTVPFAALDRLRGLVGGSDGILLDPLFGGPIKFFLVDQIYDQNGNPEPNLAGVNEYNETMTVWTDGRITDANAARIIEIKNWNDADSQAQQWAIHTMVHEIGHSWDAYGLPTKGAVNTAWLQNNQQYFSQFIKLSGWTVKPGHKPEDKDGWTTTAPVSAFASDYAMTNPNEDWAETFELASEPGLVLSNYSQTLQAKIKLVQKFLNLTVPSAATLGSVTNESFNVYR
jgi:hypothetical protein